MLPNHFSGYGSPYNIHVQIPPVLNYHSVPSHTYISRNYGQFEYKEGSVNVPGRHVLGCSEGPENKEG